MAENPEVLSLQSLNLAADLKIIIHVLSLKLFHPSKVLLNTLSESASLYSSVVLLFEFSAFGIIFHGVKSVFIGNLSHSPLHWS